MVIQLEGSEVSDVMKLPKEKFHEYVKLREKGLSHKTAMDRVVS